MKENGLSVLMFLFDNYLLGGEYIQEGHDLASELEDIGFHEKDINEAFDWLDELALLQESPTSFLVSQYAESSFRIYTPEEQTKLDCHCRGFLLNLEEMGVLDCITREIIIDRAMVVEANTFTLPEFKRIVGLIMINRIAEDEALLWLEDLICDVNQISVFH